MITFRFAKFICLVLSLTTSSLIFASSQARNTCLDLWPQYQDAGFVRLSYKISEHCEIVDVKILESKPLGVFDELARCEINKPFIAFAPTNSSAVITQQEYQDTLSRYRERNPDKYQNRSLSIKSSEDESVKLKCYFNESGAATGYETFDAEGHSSTVGREYIDTLPLQIFEARFQQEN